MRRVSKTSDSEYEKPVISSISWLISKTLRTFRRWRSWGFRRIQISIIWSGNSSGSWISGATLVIAALAALHQNSLPSMPLAVRQQLFQPRWDRLTSRLRKIGPISYNHAIKLGIHHIRIDNAGSENGSECVSRSVSLDIRAVWSKVIGIVHSLLLEEHRFIDSYKQKINCWKWNFILLFVLFHKSSGTASVWTCALEFEQSAIDIDIA